MPKKRKRRYYRINQYIKAREVRLVDKEGRQIGIVRFEEALKKAEEEGLDLVEVAPQATPPVCRILDFRQWLYKNGIKRKGRKGGDLKEVRLRPFVSKHDFEVKIEKIKKFLAEKSPVRITIRFRGRELRRKERGEMLFAEIRERLKDTGKVVSPPKFKGRMFIGILGPR